MVIEQWGFFSVPHLLWHGTSIYMYNGHLRRPVTLNFSTGAVMTCFNDFKLYNSLQLHTYQKIYYSFSFSIRFLSFYFVSLLFSFDFFIHASKGKGGEVVTFPYLLWIRHSSLSFPPSQPSLKDCRNRYVYFGSMTFTLVRGAKWRRTYLISLHLSKNTAKMMPNWPYTAGILNKQIFWGIEIYQHTLNERICLDSQWM